MRGARVSRRGSAATVTLLLVLCAVCSVLGACGAMDDQRPARSPLGEPSTPVATAPAATATATAAPTSTAAPVTTAPAGATPPAALAESATGRAIALLSEWLGVPQTDLAVVSVEAVVWPDACLGVAAPLACAQATTPGFRVRLRDALGALHSMHSDASGASVRWAGETVASGLVTAVDAGSRRITLSVDGRPLVLRLAPGTRWTPATTEAAAGGHRVAVGYDPASSAASMGTAAWLVLDPP